MMRLAETPDAGIEPVPAAINEAHARRDTSMIRLNGYYVNRR